MVDVRLNSEKSVFPLKKPLIRGIMASFFLLSIIFLSIFIASQGTIDNTKNFNATTGEVVIKNASGTAIASMKLDTPQVNYVMRGKNRLVAEFTINNLETYKKEVLGGINFINLNKNTSITRDFTYKEKILSGTKDVPDYSEVCGADIISGNGSKSKNCTTRIIGTHKENVYEWKEFIPADLTTFTKGNRTIGIFTEVYAGDYVEWKPILYGVEVVEWAIYSDALRTELIGYWAFNENTGTKVYNLANNLTGNLTLASGTNWVKGKNGTAYLTSGIDIINSTFINSTWTTCSINFWVNRTGATGFGKYFFSTTEATGVTQGTLTLYGGSGNDGVIKVVSSASTFTSPDNLPFGVGIWQMFTLVMNTTDMYFYHNGSIVGSVHVATTFDNYPLHIFSYGGGNQLTNAVMDEISLYSRMLTDTEISNLYDSGVGTFWELPSDKILPNIVITSPLNNTNTSNKGINVNYSASDETELDDCWYSNTSGLVNYTLTGCSNITGVSWNEGANSVYVWANDTAGNQNYSYVYFYVDTIKPQIRIIFPLNNTNTSNTGLDINYTASDNHWLGSCWYSNDSYSKNTSLATCGTNITTVTWVEGLHNITIWANDTAGNENSTSLRFYIDTTPPNVAIIFPLNNSNYTDINLDLLYTYSDYSPIGNCWYSLDFGKNNASLTCGQNITTKIWTKLNYVTIYVNDSIGNQNYSYVFFNATEPLPLTSGTGGTFISLVASIPANETNIPSPITLKSIWDIIEENWIILIAVIFGLFLWAVPKEKRDGKKIS